MTMKILIPAQLAAVVSDSFNTGAGNTTSMICNGLSAGELCGVEIYDPVKVGSIDYPDGWTPYLINGLQVQFSSANVVVEIYESSLTYRVKKGATANKVGVSISQFIQPLNGVY